MPILNNLTVNEISAGPERYIKYTVNNGSLEVATDSPLMDFTGVTNIPSYTLFGAYSENTTIGVVDMSSVKTVGQYGMRECFGSHDGGVGSTITKLDLSGIESASEGLYQFGSMCENCTSLTEVDMSRLIKSTFSSATSSGAPLVHAFRECTALRIFRFDSLKNLGKYALSFTFAETEDIDIYFPAIKTIGATNTFYSTLSLATNATLHFPSNTQSVVEALSGYSTTTPFGATSGTVLFDLPAVVTLTGANAVNYERNPKYDTATALAWRVEDVDDTVDWTPFYTSGTTDPAVNDTIYSDSACTTTVTTISSIA